MDINKYIGKFLIKNKYCSLPGLGVFELKKLGAKLNSNTETIAPPSYKVSFTPIGSIDDTFASFIATAENVSISNASNNIREYCKEVKEELNKTGKYDIDYLGRFSMSAGKIVFQQSDELDLGAEPAPLAPLLEKVKVPETVADKPDYSYPPARKQRSIPVMKIALPILILGALATAGYFGYDYYKKNADLASEEITEPAPTQIDTLTTVIDSTLLNKDTLSSVSDSVSTIQDTTMTATSAVSATPTTTTQSGTAYNVAILSYDNEASATLKATKLKNYGNNASVVNSNGKFVVIINASHPMNDTTKLVDSLRKFFNPKGPVYIMK